MSRYEYFMALARTYLMMANGSGRPEHAKRGKQACLKAIKERSKLPMVIESYSNVYYLPPMPQTQTIIMPRKKVLRY